MISARSQPTPDGRSTQPIKPSVRTIYECGGFFQQKFVDAIRDWGVADRDTLEMIEKFKGERGAFEQITREIMNYNVKECRLLATMMGKFRDSTRECESELLKIFPERQIKLWPSRPSGAGYMAARMHETAGTPKRPRDRPAKIPSSYLPERPPELEAAANHAYYGGRFEISRTGEIRGPVYGAGGATPKRRCIVCAKSWLS
jgi:hypothetical protein